MSGDDVSEDPPTVKEKPKNHDDNEKSWSDGEIEFICNYWELTGTERRQFLELQHRLADIHHWKNNPDVVVRFLRARPNDVQAAETMFRTMIQWRLDTKADTILENYNPHPLLKTRFPGAILQGLDKQGDPIFISRAGSTDARGFLKRFGHEEMIRHSIWLREMTTRGPWIAEYEREAKRPVKRVTIVEDLAGLPLMPSRNELALFQEIMRLDQDNYCETAKRLIILNVPFFFRAIWAIVKHFFDPGVVDKMIFLSADYLQALDHHIDRKVLPQCLCPQEGKGVVAIGFEENLQGGKIPIN